MGTARAQFVGVPKPAALLIAVDKRYQRMVVTVDGQPRFKWSVSTGARGYAIASTSALRAASRSSTASTAASAITVMGSRLILIFK